MQNPSIVTKSALVEPPCVGGSSTPCSEKLRSTNVRKFKFAIAHQQPVTEIWPRLQSSSTPENESGTKICFGLNLDGYHSPIPKSAFNTATCGPRGFLQLLETRLGLRSVPVSPFKRLLQFRQAVLEAARQPVFFRESAQQDSLATARVLLIWRDGLIEAAWDGQAAEGDPQRLRDLAALEAIVRRSVSPGDADRLAAIHRELQVRSPGQVHLEVLDCKEHLPQLWQKVCDQLHASGPKDVDPISARWPATGDATDLINYQAHVANRHTGKFTPKNDGSLLVLTAHSEIALARAVAQIINRREQQQSLSLIAGSQASILDQALFAEDEPLIGLQLRSVARPIPQLLSLALRLRWQPANPGVLLEFLAHPACPVGAILRQRLSAALAASPGIGGPQWRAAIAEARAAGDKLTDEERATSGCDRIDEDLERWILIERFEPVAGVPGAKLSEFCMQLSRWASTRSDQPDTSEIEISHFHHLSVISSELAEALLGLERISQLELEKFLEALYSAGWEGEVVEPQLGHVHCLHHPHAAIAEAEKIIWWNFSEPPENKPVPWSRAEMQAFATHGAKFVAPETQATLTVKSWMRPLLAARKQLVLVVPKQRDSQPLPRHPLLARLLAVTEGSPGHLPIRDLDRELFQQQAMAPLTFNSLKHRPLPPPRRWWKMRDGKWLNPRTVESYSSLERFIHAPFIWALTHAARLQSGPMTTLKLRPDSSLKGTLLHRLLDLLLAGPHSHINWLACTRPTLESWCDQQWEQLLVQEGATLLQPGNLSEKLSLLDLAKRSLWELLQQMRAAKVRIATTNVKPNAASFIGGTLVGYIDLLVQNESAQTAVIDLKLGGAELRQQELKTNRQLQLAVYGYLQHHQHLKWPEAAFFILGQQRLLAQSDSYFPQAAVQKMAVAQTGLENCWNDFESVWRWRREQFAAGWIEVTTAPLPIVPDSSQPDSTAPRINWKSDPDEINYNDFYTLTGWRADQ